MNDKLSQLLAPPELEQELFPANSRYRGIPVCTLKTASGKEIAYLKRRFVPDTDNLAIIQDHSVVQGDRLDNLSHEYLGDPELFWRLCDANGAIRPSVLTASIGRSLKIALPEGIPGDGDA